MGIFIISELGYRELIVDLSISIAKHIFFHIRIIRVSLLMLKHHIKCVNGTHSGF